jgi:Acetyltransferase (GNAT) domain
LRFEKVPLDDIEWSHLDAFEDRTFSQRCHWLQFVSQAQRGEIVVARLIDGEATVGYFTGIIVRRLGVRIMGSPFPGWSTPDLGFNLAPGVSRADAVAALLPFVFRELRCLHIELSDPQLTRADVERFGFDVRVGTTFVSDLAEDEDVLYSRMGNSTRRAIRKSEKSGVTIEVASPDGFAEEFYAHLIDVFAKQRLRPTYDRERVEGLVRCVHPSGDLLLLRARDPEGRSIATGIFPGYNRRSYFWGNGSLREHQILRPNEAIHWSAMRYWRERGIATHDWGGAGDYKQKYGGKRVQTLHFRISRYAAIGVARDVARGAYYLPRTIKRKRHLVRVDRIERAP